MIRRVKDKRVVKVLDELPDSPQGLIVKLIEVFQINLADLKGKVVYLDFWATWCPPCRKSFPWMQEIYQRYKDMGLAVVTVSVNAREKDAEKFIKEHNPSFITAFDPGKKTANSYNLEAMPSSYLIDRQGNIISTHLGFRVSNTSKVEAEIKQALKQ